MSVQFTNWASSTLAANITAGATTLTLKAGTGDLFPLVTTLSGAFFFLVLEHRTSTGTKREIVKVTNRSGTTCTVVRGQDGTTAQAFSRGATVSLRITAAVLEALRDGGSIGVDLSVTGWLAVGGNATVSGDFLVNGSVSIEDSIYVAGVASVAGGATVGSLQTIGDATVAGDALVNGGLAVEDGIVVTGAASITGNTTVGGTLSVDQIAVSGLAIVDTADISGTEESQPFPSGKILKMGRVTTSGTGGATGHPNGSATVTFAAAFPTECTGVLVSVEGTTPGVGVTSDIVLTVSDYTASGFKVASFRASDGALIAAIAVTWFAWGK